MFAEGKLRIKRMGGRTGDFPLGSGRRGSGKSAVLPGSTVDFASMFEEVEPSEYKARLRIYYGARRPVGVDIKFSVTGEGVTGKTVRTVNFEVPDVLEKKIVPGGHRTFTIPVMNLDNDIIHVKGRAIAFRFNEFGELVLEQEVPLSVLSSTKLTWPLNKDGECELDLKPKQWMRVKVEVDLSKVSKGTGGRYVGFEFTGEKEGVEGATILNSSVLLVMPGELKKSGEIVDKQRFRSEGTRFMNFWVGFKNTGNIHVYPTGKIFLKKWNEELNEGVGGFEELGEATFEELNVPVLPDGMRYLKTIYRTDLELGRYAIDVSIEGLDEPLMLKNEEFIVEE